jgi:hypothetical protein
MNKIVQISGQQTASAREESDRDRWILRLYLDLHLAWQSLWNELTVIAIPLGTEFESKGLRCSNSLDDFVSFLEKID